MSDAGNTGDDREARLGRRRSSLEAGSSGRTVRVLVGFLIGAVLLVLTLTLVMPGELGSLFASGSSEAEKMQELADMSSGISTDFLPEPETVIETAVVAGPEIVMPGEPAPNTDQARIDALERQLEALRAGGGPSLEDIRGLLDDQAAMLRDELARAEERHQGELQAALADRGPLTAGISGIGGMSEAEAEARRRLEEERARRAEIRAAQIASDGIVLDASGRITGGSAQGGGSGTGRKLTSNERFIASASTQSYDTVRATQIAAPERTIVQGTTLQATLETAISTELPGVIRAVVSDDVWSYDGSNVLLPRGTRLIGSYNSDVSVVQDRVQLAWSRAVTPDGVSVELGGYGADTLGRSGQTGFVDGRFRQRFGSAALISLIGAAPEVVVNGNTGATGQDLAEDLGSDLESASQGVMGDYLSAPPLIYVDQGTEMTVLVNRDLVF